MRITLNIDGTGVRAEVLKGLQAHGGVMQDCVRAFLDPEEFSAKKQVAALNLIAEAEAAGFEKPDGFEARWGLA